MYVLFTGYFGEMLKKKAGEGRAAGFMARIEHCGVLKRGDKKSSVFSDFDNFFHIGLSRFFYELFFRVGQVRLNYAFSDYRNNWSGGVTI